MANEKFLFSDPISGFYKEADPAIQSSTGASDAGKLVQTGADGKLDPSLINFQSVKRYFIADYATTGSNITLSGAQTIDGATPTNGDRILVKDQSTLSENGIYIYNDAGAWTRAADYDEAAEIEDGTGVAVGQGSTLADTIWLQIRQVATVGSDPIEFISAGTNIVSAGDGISKSGNTLSADLLAAGGLKFVGTTPNGQIAVEPSDFAGTGLVDDGADNLQIDFFVPGVDNPATTDKAVDVSDLAANGANQGANLIGGDPTNISQSSATTVQGILEDLSTSIAGNTFTVGTGGVTAGDLVYISADNTVLPHATLANSEYGIGLALTTEAAAGTVTVLGNDTVAAGVLTGATAGTKYYWNGSGYTTDLSTFSAGEHIWRVGVAKNATDLYTDVEFVKVNC